MNCCTIENYVGKLFLLTIYINTLDLDHQTLLYITVYPSQPRKGESEDLICNDKRRSFLQENDDNDIYFQIMFASYSSHANN